MEWKTLEDLSLTLEEGDKMIVAPINDDICHTGKDLDVTIIFKDGTQISVVRCDRGWRFAEQKSYSDMIRD